MELQSTLAQRHGTHGDFTDNAQVTEDLMDVLRKSPQWNNLPAFAKVAIYMIVHKIARITCGDYSFNDHWKDIQGYAKISEDRFNEQPKTI
jgi:hypothetical protein